MYLRAKTGFIGFNPEVYDIRGEFYVREGEREFNLPPGEYEINNCEKITSPINYRLPSLPFPERLNIIPPLKTINLRIEKIPYQACIDTTNNQLYLHEKFEKEPSPVIYCLIGHEIGHYIYNTEYKCDIYAIYLLLKYGLNPSQFYPFIELLSDNSNYRKENVLNYAEKIDAMATTTGFFNKLFK